MPLKAKTLGEIPRLRPAPSLRRYSRDAPFALREGNTKTRGTSLLSFLLASGMTVSAEARSFEAHPGIYCRVDEIG